MADTITTKTLTKLEDLYQNGDIAGFREELIKNKTEMDVGLFHYNLGVGFAKEGNLPAAHYNFEKAKQQGFEHPALRKNIETVTSKLIVSKYGGSTIDNVTKTFVYGSESYFLFITLGLILFFSMMFRLKIIYNRWVMLMFVVVSLSPFALKKFYFNQTYLTGINLKEIKIHEGPSDIYEAIHDLPAGQKVILGKSYENWLFITYPSELSGWVKRNDLGIL